MIDALRAIVQYVHASIFHMVLRRALRFPKLEIMVPEEALLKHTVIICVLLLLLLLLILI